MCYLTVPRHARLLGQHKKEEEKKKNQENESLYFIALLNVTNQKDNGLVTAKQKTMQVSHPNLDLI